MARIGFVGTGRMGMPMCAALARAGHEVRPDRHTSNSPAAARPLRELALGRGVAVLEAPAGGGVQAAREGRLQLFAGGDAGLLAKHRPLLESLSGPGGIAHVGGHGTGYTVKLLVNLLWFGQAVGTAEVHCSPSAPGSTSGSCRRR